MTNNPDPSAYEAELLRLAEAAGADDEWTADGDCVEYLDPRAAGCPIAVTNPEGIYPEVLGKAFAAFIAAANPARIIALLAENARLRECVRKDGDFIRRVADVQTTTPISEARARLADREVG